MQQVYRWFLALYPRHVQTMYAAEMLADFSRRLESQSTRVAALASFVREVIRVVPDALAERFAAVSSHPSFHGRRPSDLGVVRPPNVGKREWFYGDGPPSSRFN